MCSVAYFPYSNSSHYLGIFNNPIKSITKFHRISILMHFSSHSLCLYDFRPRLVILPNLTHFGHDGSCYFNNYRRTKHPIMIQ